MTAGVTAALMVIQVLGSLACGGLSLLTAFLTAGVLVFFAGLSAWTGRKRPQPAVYFAPDAPLTDAWRRLHHVLDDMVDSPLWAGTMTRTGGLKRNALCSHTFDVCQAELDTDLAPLESNATTWTWSTPRGLRHLLPSGVLVQDTDGQASHISWSLVDLAISAVEIPGPQLPGACGLEAKRMSWMYVNMNGEPDQRHTVGNEQIPVYAVWVVHLTDEEGILDEVLVVPTSANARQLRAALADVLKAS